METGKVQAGNTRFFIPQQGYVQIISFYSQTPLNLTDTSLIWTPCYYGQFALSLWKALPYIFSQFNPLNLDTSWTLYKSTNIHIQILQTDLHTFS